MRMSFGRYENMAYWGTEREPESTVFSLQAMDAIDKRGDCDALSMSSGRLRVTLRCT